MRFGEGVEIIWCVSGDTGEKSPRAKVSPAAQ